MFGLKGRDQRVLGVNRKDFRSFSQPQADDVIDHGAPASLCLAIMVSALQTLIQIKLHALREMILVWPWITMHT